MTTTPLPPWEPNDDQNNLVNNVNMYYSDANNLSLNNDRINGIMGQIDAFQKDGNFDAAMMLVITALFPAIIDRTSWEQKTYIDRQSIGAAMNVMGADHSEAAFEGGQSAKIAGYEPVTTTNVWTYSGGMTDDQATTFQQDTYWLDYDLHYGMYTDAQGNTHDSMLSMIDTTTQNDIVGNLEGIMGQYKNADGSSCTALDFAKLPINNPDHDTANTTWSNFNQNPKQANSIKFQTDAMWTPAQSSDGTPTGTPATQVLGLFQNTTNTCNAAEQSFNSWYQQWVSWENNYIGSTGDIMKSVTTQNTAFVNATKPS